MKKKIIIWTLIIVMSLSVVGAAVLVLVNNAGNADIGVFQKNSSSETTSMGNSQEDSGEDIGNDSEQDGDSYNNGGQDDDLDNDSEQDGDSYHNGGQDGDSYNNGGQDDDLDDDIKYEYQTVRFVTNGGDAVTSIKVKKGETLSSVPVTQRNGAFFDGWYTDKALSEQFYQSEPIFADTTLYAKYDEQEQQQTLLYEKYTLNDQKSDLAFTLKSDQTLTTAEVLDLITLEIADGSKYIVLTSSGSNPYTISADGGFTPGATYVLTLGEGLTFDGQPESCRKCSFNIHKDEVMNLKVNESLTYINADEIDNIIVNGESVEKISSGLTGNGDLMIGSFTYSASILSVGSVICIYNDTHPNNRTIDGDYTDQDIAYLRVKEVNGDTVTFESLDEEDAEEVLFLPDTFPLDINDFPGEFSEGDYDFDIDFDPAYFSEFADMGIDEDTTVDPGDYIVLYDDGDPDFADYYEIAHVEPNGGLLHITLDDITLEEMLQAMDYYTENSRNGQEMLDNVDIDHLERQIETQVMTSGFAQKSLDYLAAASMQTGGFKNISSLKNIVITNENGKPLSGHEIELWKHSISGTSNGITVNASISNETDHFSKGVQVALQIDGEYTVDVGDSGEISILISATFVQEVAINFGVSGSVEWGWYVFIPYIKDVQMAAYVDIYDFTGISFNVKVETHDADDRFSYTDITDQLENLLDITDPDELDAGVEDLFEKYCEMLKTDTDYIEIFNKSVFNQEGWVDPLCIIAYNIEVNFKIYADINIMLGANMEYMSGTRYIFWFKVVEGKAGSATVDLIDETFEFQFYVMGKLGLKVGLEFKFAVGLFSTHLDSIGLSAEAGPYLELYGYFIYEYSKIRPAGAANSIINEEILGALYIEFGIYFESYFNASLLEDECSYSYPLYEDEWKLLTAGVNGNVYDFAYDIGKDETYVIRDKTSAILPSSYRNMAVLGLKEGNLYQDIYPLAKYNYRLSNPNFKFNAQTGQITVNVPSSVQYMECDLTMTWKVDKLAFRKKDMTSTIHLVWTSLTAKEMEEKFEVSVKVGNITVWSDRVIKNSVFELPSEDAIKELIGYDDETAVINGNTVNLKYASSGKYRYIDSLEQTVYKDTVYYFDVTEKDYEITIDGIENTDGTTRSQTFMAGYNERFDLSALESTGTNDGDSGTYTIYVRTDCDPGDGKKATDVINREFAIQLLKGEAKYMATYADNSCKVTYHFVTDPDPDIDMEIADIVETVAKGTRPNFDYTEYLDELDPRYMVDEWQDGITPGKVTSETTFTAHCKVAADVPKYTITFVEKGGSDVDDCQRYLGQTIEAPSEPAKEGYTFACWCEDEGLLTEYEFSTMPDHDLTLYAKWTVNQYTVELDYIEGKGTSVDPAAKNVTYDSDYGELPTPVYDSNLYYFLGWFTSATGGTEVASDTIMTRAENHTLYAQYNTLVEIERQHIEWNLREETYNSTLVESWPGAGYYYEDPVEHPYTLSFSGSDYPKDGYTVWYRKEGFSDYTTQIPTDAGNYYIRTKRDADDTYRSFEATSTIAVHIVHQAVREYVPPAPDYRGIGSGCTFVVWNTIFGLIWNDMELCDGYVRYAATKTPVCPCADSDDWVSASQLGYDQTGTTYYLWTKIDGENYTDAFSTNYTQVTVPVSQPGG